MPYLIMQCVDGTPGACTEAENLAYKSYGEQMQREVKAYLEIAGSKSRAFLIEEAYHCEITGARYNSATVNGVTMRQAIEAWFFAR